MSYQQRKRILQILYEEQIHTPLYTFGREDLLHRMGVSWTDIKHEVDYLEAAKYIAFKRRSIGRRNVETLHITDGGMRWIEEPKELPSEMESIPITLRLEPENDSAKVTWEADMLGHVTSNFRSPYNAITLPIAIKALDAIQWPAHPYEGPQFSPAEQDQLTTFGLWTEDRVSANVHQQIGRALYNSLIADPKGRVALSTARNYAAAQGLPLSYLIRFPSQATNLAALPWELLWDEHGALLLSRGKLASCTRYLDLDYALPPPSPPGRLLRILAIAPNVGIPPSLLTEERTAWLNAWDKLIKAGAVEVEELSPATPKMLTDRIHEDRAVDIIHFYGHGRYREGQGALLFDTPNGGETWLSADQLAVLLGVAVPRLVVLHACQSAMTSREGLLTGVAPALSAAGVPVVVAMQLTVRANTAIRFSDIVYRSLARGNSVQYAVSQARQALYVEESDGTGWYVPTLTIRARDFGPVRLMDFP